MKTTKAEQETILRYDQEERLLRLYTAYAADARKWARPGYTVEIGSRAQTGDPRSWVAQAPFEALRLRRLVNGKVAGSQRGRSFGVTGRKFAASATRTHRDGGGGSTRIPRTSTTAD